MAKGDGNYGTRVSMQNVAAYAGVSIATVSKVMQGVPTVLPENVTKVQNAIEALGYRINPLGAELRRGRRNLIGVIVPTLEDPSVGRLLTELEEQVEARGHVLFVASSRGSEAREADLANRMQDWRVAGVLVLPVKGQGSPAALLLEDAGLAAVYLHRSSRVQRFDTVAPDYAGLLEQLRTDAPSTGAKVAVKGHDAFADGFWVGAFLKAIAKFRQPIELATPESALNSAIPFAVNLNSDAGTASTYALPIERIATRSIDLLFHRMSHHDDKLVCNLEAFRVSAVKKAQ